VPQEQNTATATAPVLTKTPTKAPPTATNTPPPTFTPTPGIGSTKVSEKDGMVMVFVPAGEFTMGSDTGQMKNPFIR
jgi:formylglycine-generating enzyme required for sulfatase activity